MSNNLIAIIGAGPAGSSAAERLARGGREVVLFDEKLAWEKPCGGGITDKALARYEYLRDPGVERNWVEQCELISPAGRRVTFHLTHPVAIFSRRVLNGFLLERARSAGSNILQGRVTDISGTPGKWRLRTKEGDISAAFLVFATGARNPFRAQFSHPFAPEDLMATAGYYLPGSGPCMQIQFLTGLHGYIWIFPRCDHLSAGICGRMGNKATAELRRILEDRLTAAGLDFRGGTFYSHLLPSLRFSTLRSAPVCGQGWAAIGDAAGFTDPITGEGLYYALRSAEFLSDALLANQVDAYGKRLLKDFLPELEMAARIADRFFTGSWMGESVTERMVQFTASSPKFQQLMCDMFAGSQGYLDLRQRLCRSLPFMMAESVVNLLGLRRRRSQVSTETKAVS
jgi:geranylgeranyl diphosphate/geranylgeranyl-bacteriochlorophyllide a reductase